MKDKFLNFSLNLIKKNRKDIDDIKLDEIRYGLEGIYLTFTKAVIIFSICLVLGIFKEMIILLFIFNILRRTGFGLHASKSWICLISSGSIFIILPFIAKLIIIPIYIKSILGIISILFIFKNTPADTIKRPIISTKLREKFNFITTVKCIILAFLALILKNEILANLIIFGIYIEVFLTSPYIYRIFKLSYNNYLTYDLA